MGCIRSLFTLSLCIAYFNGGIATITPRISTRDKIGLSLSEAQKALLLFKTIAIPSKGIEAIALSDCKELLELNIDVLSNCYTLLSNSDSLTNSTWSRTESSFYKSWISSVITNAETCRQSLTEANMDATKLLFTNSLVGTSTFCSESLAVMENVGMKIGRILYEKSTEPLPYYGSLKEDSFPSWVSNADRRLMEDSIVVANLTVSQDGSGNFTSICEAFAAAPDKSSERFIIFVKAGVYQENVDVGKTKTNIMMVGEGINVTVIRGNRSVVDGFTTFNSATFAVVGQKFIAKGITFENTAGPEKHQAVALRSGSDLSVFYQCSFKAYQDTLYTHSLRQFYRDCEIYGTVDFVFGNSAVVLQNCQLFARKPMNGQMNLFTAQGRTDPNQNTGISMHNCSIMAAEDLLPVKSQFKSYLGRPWKEYSRTVYMQSFIDDVIDPKGWLEWNGDFALSTLYYGEYNNTGPGSPTEQRVTWPGYNVMDAVAANNFTVKNFIVGDSWIPSDIPYTAELV